jgi:hypothetical protein
MLRNKHDYDAMPMPVTLPKAAKPGGGWVAGSNVVAMATKKVETDSNGQGKSGLECRPARRCRYDYEACPT